MLQLKARDLRVGDQVTAGLPATTTVTALRLVETWRGLMVRVATTTLGTLTVDDALQLTVTRPGGGGDEPAYDRALDAGVAAALGNDDSATAKRLRAASVAAVEDADEVTPTGAWDFTGATVTGVSGGGGGGPITASQITDATATGRNVLTAATQAAARSAIGAGTSSFSGAYADLTGTPTLDAATVGALDVAQPLRGMPSPVPPARIISRFPSGHGWTSFTPAQLADDTAVKVHTDRTLRVATLGAGAAVYANSPVYGTPQDWTGYTLRLKIRVSDAGRVNLVQIYLVTGTGNNFVCTLQPFTVSGEFITLHLGRSQFRNNAGTPVWTGITQVQVVVQDKSTGALTVHLGAVELIPDHAVKYPNGVFILEADDGYAGQKTNLLPIVGARGVPVTLNPISERITGGAAGLTVADLLDFHHVHGWQISPHAHTLAGHNGPSTPAQMAVEFRAQKEWLRSLGLAAGVDDYSLCPSTGTDGALTTDMLAALRSSFRSARMFTGMYENVIPGEYHRLRCIGFGGNSVANLQTNIDFVAGPGGALILGLHDVLAGGTNGTTGGTASIAANNLATVLDYAAGKGMKFLTRGQWLDSVAA